MITLKTCDVGNHNVQDENAFTIPLFTLKNSYLYGSMYIFYLYFCLAVYLSNFTGPFTAKATDKKVEVGGVTPVCSEGEGGVRERREEATRKEKKRGVRKEKG